MLRTDARGFTQEAINVYADQAGTVQGQVQCPGDPYNSTLRYNLTLVRGWNLVANNIEVVSDSSLIATYSSVNEADVAAFNWYAYVP